MNNPAIELCAVSRFFEEGSIHALDSVTLTIQKGETVAVVGPSGSGKSTLLSLIGALDFASSGEVRIMGELITRKRDLAPLRNNLIGFVFQLHHLLPHLTLEENVMAVLRPCRIPVKEARLRSREMIERVGLTARAGFLPGKLSSGERQRAALARALVNDPQIILADEPTGNLDSVNGALVVDQLLRAARGRTLVVVTHNPEVAAHMGRVVKLLDGRVVS